MKKMLLIFSLMLFGHMAIADVVYTKEAFESAQKRNEKIILDFFADWCPTCKVQARSLKKLEDQGQLKGVTLFKVNFDKETELKQALKVSAQSTLVAFYGNVETARVTGITDEKSLNEFLSKLKTLALKDQLRMMQEASRAKIPPEKLKVMEEALATLKKAKIEEKSIKVGEKFPDVTLKNAHGKDIKLSDLRKSGPVVITFYRGSWCPYCNAQLSNFQQNLPELKKRGAQLVALTPEKPDLSVLMSEKKKLEFEILNDRDNNFATKLGLTFEVSKDVKDIYQKFGIDLEKSQGNADWKLPIPATFVVKKDGTVSYAFVDSDYTKRASAEDVIKALDQSKD